jgi:hypothetical protein
MPQRLLLEGSDIDELLLRVQSEHGPHAKIVHAEQKLVGGVAGFFARRRYELSVQVDEPRSVALATTPASTDGEATAFEDLLARADSADGAVGPTAGGGGPRPLSSPVATGRPTGRAAGAVPTPSGRRLSTQSPQFEGLLSTLLSRAERGPSEAGTTSPSEGPAEARSAAVEALLQLGLPADRLPAHLSSDARAALLDVLEQLPAPAQGRLWGTTVVVGPAELAARAVDALVDHTGGAGTGPLTSDSCAPSSADLAVRASALCATHGAAVVVIQTPATRAAARRAGRLIAGLGLGTVIAAVDATRDTAATKEWLAELGAAGRCVDQLAAFDVAESTTPLSLLALGPDVGWLDGRPASLGTWAAPCLDRQVAAARRERNLA